MRDPRDKLRHGCVQCVRRDRLEGVENDLCRCVLTLTKSLYEHRAPQRLVS